MALRTGLRLLVGTFFVASGVAKLTVSPLPGIPPGLNGFAAYLAAAGIPFPVLGAVAACAVEIVCGAGLVGGVFEHRLRRLTPWFAALLAGEMAVAMAFVGVPTALGDPVVLEGTAVTNEAYRLPLELGLFLYLVYLARGSRRSAPAAMTSAAG